jgi:hypothetical protein
MITEADLPIPTNRLNSAAMLAIAESMGLSAPTRDEMIMAREMAGRRMGHEVVSLATLEAVQEVQPAATLVFMEDGEVTAVSGQLLLSPGSVRPIFEGAFDALEVDVRYLTVEGEVAALGYAWGIAATTKKGGAAVIAVGKALRAALFPDLTIFTRAVTPVGRHIAVDRHGYVPLRAPDDELLIRLPKLDLAA